MKNMNLDAAPRRTNLVRGAPNAANITGQKAEKRSDSYAGGGPTTTVPTNVDRVVQQQVANSGSGFGAVLGALGLNRLKKMTKVATLFIGATMISGTAMADYVRIDQPQAQIVVSAEINPAIIASASVNEPAFDAGNLEQYPLFKMFWASELPGTSQHGVWALSTEGVKHLLEYARTHTLDGLRLPNPSSASGPIAVTEGHQALIEHLLNDAYYPAFISQDATPMLRTAFALPEVEVQARPEHKPVDAGEVRVCAPAEWWGSQGISTWHIRNLPSGLATEFDLGSRVGRYDGAASSADQQQYELTCLLHQFGTALNRWDDLAPLPKDQIKHQLQDQLLDKFFGLPVFDPAHNENAGELRAYFARDFNGSGMGLAQVIAKGFEPNSFITEFPNASGRGSPVSLSMSTGNLKQAMTVLDQLRVAAGLPAQALELKNRPANAYMVGEPSGHDKVQFNETRPPIHRLNYGKMIMVGSLGDGFNKDARLRNLPPTSGFTFPIDAVTATGAAVIANDNSRLEVFRASDKQRLTVAANFEVDGDGKETSWSLEFRDRAGMIVSPADVVGILQGVRSRGDGIANQSLDMSYWGQCDDNTGANAIFGRFKDLPESFTGQVADSDRVFIRTGDTITPVTLQQARELVYMDLPGIGNTEHPVNGGFRFGEDPSEISWQRGSTLYKNFGLIEGFTPSPFTQSTHSFQYNDVLRIPNTADQPLLGTLRLDTGEQDPNYVQASDVQAIVQLGEGQVKVFYRSGNNTYNVTGRPLTDLSAIDWSNAEMAVDPSTNTPGQSKTTTQPTLAAFFENDLKDTGITLPDLLRANPDITSRPDATVAPTENVKIPEFSFEVAFQGGTAADFLAKHAEAIGANERAFSRTNDDALRAIATPILEVGQALRLPVGDGTMGYIVRDGDTFGAIVAAHATTDVSAEAIESKLREDGGLFRDLAKIELPSDGSIALTVEARNQSVGGDAPQTLDQVYAAHSVADYGISAEAFKTANEAIAERPAGWVSRADKVIVPERAMSFSDDNPLRGDFFMRRTDGVDIVVKASEVDYVQGETPHDVRFTHYVRFVQLSEGVYGNEGSLRRSISNGRKWVDNVQLYQTQGADRPEWAGDAALRGIKGPLERQPGDKIVFAAGTAQTSKTYRNTTFVGWYQVDESTGRVLNEGFISGEPDFVWGIHDTGLNWNAPSTYIGGAMVADFRIGIVVNGIADLRNQTEEGDRIAASLDLPSNWRNHIVPQAQVAAFIAAENAASESATSSEPQASAPANGN